MSRGLGDVYKRQIIQSRYAITKRDRTIHGRMREYLYFLTHSERFKTVVLPVGDGAALSQVVPGGISNND